MINRDVNTSLNSSPKAGQSLISLRPELITAIYNHPAQMANLRTISSLLNFLRNCNGWTDLNDFQKLLFQHVYTAEERRSECTRIVRRLQRGEKLPQNCPEPPLTGNPSEIDSWKIEVFIFERIARQLRTVGDAMAWMCFKYDRKLIVALSYNQSAGPMFGKEGLGYELGRVEELQQEKRFGLLHDLTNCLRIADLTEFTPSGTPLLREIKKSRGVSGVQKTRIQDAINAVNTGTFFARNRPNSGPVMLQEKHKTNLKSLNDLIQLSKVRGTAGMQLPFGRALIASSLPQYVAKWGESPENFVSSMNTTRQAAMKRAKITNDLHTMRATSGDLASRSVSLTPVSIYPFSSEDCASIICDHSIYETIISIDSLVRVFESVNLRAEILLPDEHGTVSENDNVLRISDGNRTMTVHGAGMNQLLFETFDPRSWAMGIKESFEMGDLPGEPTILFFRESRSWARNRLEI